MPVTSSRDKSVAAEQIKFNSFGSGEAVVHPVTFRRSLKTCFVELLS
jgi:hypothetical protein